MGEAPQRLACERDDHDPAQPDAARHGAEAGRHETSTPHRSDPCDELDGNDWNNEPDDVPWGQPMRWAPHLADEQRPAKPIAWAPSTITDSNA